MLGELRRLKLEEDTLVIFTADQGLAGGHSGFWGMGETVTSHGVTRKAGIPGGGRRGPGDEEEADMLKGHRNG